MATTKKVPDNMVIYEGHREPPKEALRTINAGRLKGFSDINPMWRIKALTEEFGPCGIGWYYTVDKQWLEECGDETVAFVNISLYVKVDGEWSKPIFGNGGSKLITMERNGAFVSDECVDGDCEILTKNGWVKFKDYNGTDEIAQFDKDTSEISFVKPINFIHKVSSNTYKKGNIIMTYGHRIMYENQRGQRLVDTAENLYGYKGRGYFDIHSGFYGAEKELTPLQKVGIMLCCDGTKHSVTSEGNIIWNVSFAKERKIKKCLELLKEANIEIKYTHTSKSDRPNRNDCTQIRFVLDNTDYKKYSNFLPYANYKGLMDEAIFWDGSYSAYVKERHGSFFSINYENISYLQTLLMMSNQYATIYTKERENMKHNTIYTLYNHLSKRSIQEPIERYGKETEVFCVEVPSTFFMVRKDDKIQVTGNCYKMSVTDAIGVAAKQLGIAADVYWNNDRTKYETPSAKGNDKTESNSCLTQNAKEEEQAEPEVDTRLLPTQDNKMSKEQYDFLLEEIKRTDSMADVVKYAKTEDLTTLSSRKCVALLIGLIKRPTKNA